MRSTTTRSATVLSGVAVLSLALAACGGTATEAASDPSTPDVVSSDEVSAEFNEADVTFAQGMIPHHRQAVQMAELAQGRAESPDVLALAEEISAAQGPEIETMTAFLDAWGAAVPEEGMAVDSGMEGMDMGGMTGMMSEEDMASLESSEGAGFDQMWLQMMVEHHTGAVEMAKVELDTGVNPEAQALAEEIVKAQESEIAQMNELIAAS